MSYFSYSSGISTNPLLATTTNLIVGDRVEVTDQHLTTYERHGSIVEVVTLHCGAICYEVQIDTDRNGDNPRQLLIANQLHLFPKSGHGQEVSA
jgi:hypothetical protein